MNNTVTYYRKLWADKFENIILTKSPEYLDYGRPGSKWFIRVGDRVFWNFKNGYQGGAARRLLQRLVSSEQIPLEMFDQLEPMVNYVTTNVLNRKKIKEVKQSMKVTK